MKNWIHGSELVDTFTIKAFFPKKMIMKFRKFGSMYIYQSAGSTLCSIKGFPVKP